MRHPKETIRGWIEMVNTEGRGLSKWEQEFMESITERFIDPSSDRLGTLSDRQEEILERIYSDKTP